MAPESGISRENNDGEKEEIKQHFHTSGMWALETDV